MVKMFLSLISLFVSMAAFAEQATITVKENNVSWRDQYDYVACRSTWVPNESSALLKLGNAPVIGILNDGVTKIRLAPNQMSAGWGFPSSEVKGNTVKIIASMSKDSNMNFDVEKGDSKVIGGFSITSMNRLQINVTYKGQTFYLWCQPIAL